LGSVPFWCSPIPFMSMFTMKALSMVFGLASAGQLQDQLSALLSGDKRRSMKDMQQALLSTEINPDVKVSMQKVITMIDEEFKQTIQQEHNAAQSAVDAAVKTLSDSTNNAVVAWKAAVTLDDSWVTALNEEEELKTTHEGLVDVREAAIKEKLRLCTLEMEARPFKFTPPPNEKFTCDAFNKCTDAAAKRQGNVNAWVAELNGQVDKHQAAYGVALTNCETGREASSKATTAAEIGKKNWEAQTSKREGIAEKRLLSLCSLGNKVNTKCIAKVEYEDVVSKCKAPGHALSQVDRQDELFTMETTKCMLQDFTNDVKITDATLKVCESSVDFASSVGLLSYKEDTFASLTTEDQFSCSTDSELIFAGVSYSTPTSDSSSADEFCQQVKA